MLGNDWTAEWKSPELFVELSNPRRDNPTTATTTEPVQTSSKIFVLLIFKNSIDCPLAQHVGSKGSESKRARVTGNISHSQKRQDRKPLATTALKTTPRCWPGASCYATSLKNQKTWKNLQWWSWAWPRLGYIALWICFLSQRYKFTTTGT